MAESFGSSFGSSTGNSTSTGGSYIPDYAESPLLRAFAQQAQALAGQMLAWGQSQYARNQTLTDQIIHDANIYSSQSRIRQDMGMAEAGVGQAADAGRQNALHDLESFGIDPSSGRYAALDKADQTREAAAKAGAGNQQRMQTEAVGRQLRTEGVNASLANENIGANLMRIPNDYLRTAMELKYPPLGNRNQSQSQQHSNQGSSNSSSSPDREPAGRGGGGAGPGGGAGGTRGPFGDGGQPGGTPANYTGRVIPGANAGAKITPVGPYGQGQQNEEDPNAWYNNDPGNFQNNDPNEWYNNDPGNFQNNDQNAGGDQGGGDQWGGGGDDWGQGGDQGNYDPYGGQDQGNYQDAGGDEDYAAGGAVDIDGTDGGHVPQEASPSQGEQTDDVRANLNADEFIIPRDVALWKGQEFFQKLIQQSRQKRVTAPAHGTPSAQRQAA